MSIFNAAYILLGLAMFVIGVIVAFQSPLGLLFIGVGGFSLLLGITATARNIP